MMHRFNGLMIGVVLLCVCWTMPAHATTDWVEGYEYSTAAQLWAVFDESCQFNPSLSTTRAFSGSQSLRLVYNGVAGKDPGAGGCFMDRYLPAKSDTLYTRFYMYMDNFAVNSTGTKITFQGQNGAYPSFWWNMKWGQPILSVEVQGIVFDNGTLGTEEAYGSLLIPRNQWVCMETRLTMSSPGVDNGIIQAWINGAQTINKTNQRMRPAVQSNLTSPTAQFEFIRQYVQHGVGTIYYDDYAVSRDARIGCTASPPGDRQAPRAPSNFSFR